VLARQFPTEVARATRERLRVEGLVDDARFARLWAASRAQGRGFGATRIRRELSAKGVVADIVEDAITAAVGDEYETALAAARLRRRRYAGLPAATVARRVSAWLQRRGFATRTIIAVLRAEGIFAGSISDDSDPPRSEPGD